MSTTSADVEFQTKINISESGFTVSIGEKYSKQAAQVQISHKKICSDNYQTMKQTIVGFMLRDLHKIRLMR